jgi:deoxyribodipyrimidine photolyase-related protein
MRTISGKNDVSAVKTIRFILGDHLTPEISSLIDIDPAQDVVLMAEVAGEATYAPHHKQKIVLVLSAMRHFASALRKRGATVDYVRLDEPGNTGSLTGELTRAVARHRPEKVIIAEPGEWRVRHDLETWAGRTSLPLEFREDNRFFASRIRFNKWAGERKQLRMEFFYRELRAENHILMEGDAPAGGKWNYDPENRKPLPARVSAPKRLRFQPDAVTREVMALVTANYQDHFGELESFDWPVTRRDALRALSDFIERALPRFGDYQDAMRADAPFLHHSLLSGALNIGLLTPREVCAAAEGAYRNGQAPLNAVEGFIRQILGWREYVRGVYWRFMPEYEKSNALDARRPLPAFYWTGETRMRCLAEVVTHTRRHAYSHHIQRLMITGNFALLAGVAPAEVERWYLAVYIDAFDWVELPNTHGMALYADNGLLASKPYAASGAYIHRMSNFCGDCAYDVKAKSGPGACPFNYLYWAFLIRNQQRLGDNPRMAFPYKTLEKWSAAQKRAITEEAEAFLDSLPS